MEKKYEYLCNERVVSLFYISEESFTYEQAVSTLDHHGYNPLYGRDYVYLLYKEWREKKIELPTDQSFIIGLASKKGLEKVTYPCGTILYYLPFIFTLGCGEKIISETCFSESGVIDNFTSCYLIAVEKE